MSRFLKFAGLGAFSFAFSVVGTVFAHETLGLRAEQAYALVLVCLVVINFVACRYLIFPGQSRSLARQAAQFLGSAAIFRGLEYLGFLALHTLVGVPYVPCIVIVQVLSFGTKFLFFDTLVFSQPRQSL